ncbi:MAG: hypothetical protein ACKN84_00275 [Candidatus Fonsibacter sp.]|jgi:polyhydroxyalkanoate synthesis regulator phasin|nr:hypothetical protein [Pelagibacterales bacterium]
MNNFKRIVSDFVNIIQKGILTGKDIKDEIITLLKFRGESIAQQLNLSTKEELDLVNKKIENLSKEIKSLKASLRKR